MTENVSRTGGLSPRDEAIAFHAACGRTVGDVAGIVGCSPRTVSRRLSRPDVQAAVDATRRKLYSENTGRIVGLLREAADRLEELIRCENDCVAMSAVKLIMETASKRLDGEDLERRVTLLEGKINGQSQ